MNFDLNLKIDKSAVFKAIEATLKEQHFTVKQQDETVS
jgi:hypothetical protein